MYWENQWAGSHSIQTLFNETLNWFMWLAILACYPQWVLLINTNTTTNNNNRLQYKRQRSEGLEQFTGLKFTRATSDRVGRWVLINARAPLSSVLDSSDASMASEIGGRLCRETTNTNSTSMTDLPYPVSKESKISRPTRPQNFLTLVSTVEYP